MIDDREDDRDAGVPLAHATSRIAQLLAVGQTARAEEMASQLIASAPDAPAGHLAMTQVHLSAHRISEAMAAAGEARRLDPENDFVQYVYGHAAMRSGRFAEAELALRDAMRLDPEDADYAIAYARLLNACDRGKAALAQAEHALELDPDHAEGHALRAQLLLAVRPKEWNLSEAAARRALALDPEDPDAHAIFGHVLMVQGRRVEAEERFRSALELDPNNQLALSGLAEAVMSDAPLYRPFLRYQMFMQRSSIGLQVAVVAGLWVIANIVTEILEATPSGAGAASFVIWGYLAVCAYTWFADPLTRWMLRRRYPWIPDSEHG